MNTFERFQKLNINHGCLGIQQLEHYEHYYCTPKDAEIIGCAGVDGIHYCTVPEFGNMIFAVTPMNLGDCVHPIARNFEDLLRLLLFCADMAAIEQCYAWDEEQFEAFLIDYPATQEQQSVLDVIREEFGLEPMADAFSYIKKLQAEFDLSGIPYTEDYYDPDMNPAAPSPPPEWKITFRGNFHEVNPKGEVGVPVPVFKEFHWAGIDWIIPEVYACEEGLVVLTLGKVDPSEVRKYMSKEPTTQEDMERMDAECPVNIHLRCSARINGDEGIYCGGNGMAWMPPMSGEGTGNTDAMWVLKHYGFDVHDAWIINRDNYRWPDGVKRNLESLEITISQRPVSLSGTHFKTPAASNVIELKHPRSDKAFTLTIENLTREKADLRTIASMGLEFPMCYTRMEYRIQPELAPHRYRIVDCSQGDEARPLHIADGPTAVQINGDAAAIGLIGGADGPTAVFMTHPAGPAKAHRIATSSMHFEHAEEIEWRIVFMEKLFPDIDLILL